MSDNNMLSHFHIHKRAQAAMFFIFVIASVVGCIAPVAPDTDIEEISLEEAQELLPFQICLPEFVPTGLTISETVRYHAEFGDPNESYVTIDYFGADRANPAFTVYERHVSARKVDFHDSTIQYASLRKLMDWQVDWETTEDLEKQIAELESQGMVEYQVDTFDSERLIVEIKSPVNLKAVLITWKLSQHVLIDIYSKLSVEETKLIADSIPDCNPYPTATP